jgi:predicted regulator of Ras-like GTPase activity (Roadblock/LC7/MglB family)
VIATEASALAEGVRASLVTLKDIVGITGSFVCTQAGRLVAREIPALFEDAVLAEAGSRLLRVGETFGAGGDELEVAIVSYGEHRIYVKSVSGGMLCIVISGPVNMSALRMAANLVARRIGSAVARAQAEMPPSDSESRPTTRPPQAKAPARQAAPPGMRRFRSRALE